MNKSNTEGKNKTAPLNNNIEKGTDFVTRLRIALGKNRGRKFAESAGISYSTLHNYLKGISLPTLDNLVKLAEATKVSVEWLSTGNECSPHASKLLTGQEIILIPYYKTENKVTTPNNLALENTEQPITKKIPVVRSWLLQHNFNEHSLVAFDATGNSMAPTINHGDQLIIQTEQKQIEDGALLLIERKGLFSVKRVQTNFDSLLLISDDKKYQTIEVQNYQKNLNIIGQVVHISKNVTL